jgi:hypothetical protein
MSLSLLERQRLQRLQGDNGHVALESGVHVGAVPPASQSA